MRYDFGNSSGSTVTNTDAIPKGELFNLSLNRGASRHFIWLGAGSFHHDLTVRWFVHGCLCFFLNNNEVGRFNFSDASKSIVQSDRDIAPRAIIRIAADGLGSVQPILRYQEFADNAADRDNLDMGCFALNVEADSVSYIVQKCAYVAPNLNRLKILLGARIVSTR